VRASKNHSHCAQILGGMTTAQTTELSLNERNQAMTNRWIRAVAATTMLSFGVGSIGCGYLLHPERRGNRGGYVAGGTLVMDLLWLIPGLVPGVVALVVDFSSGAIYVNGGYALRASDNGTVALRLPDSVTPQVLELRLVTSSDRVLAREMVAVGPNVHDRWVELDPGDSVRRSHEKIFFEIVNANGTSARLAKSIAM
jgi:hypothetical protein